MANDDDEKSNWTIKSVPVAVRQMALDAARKQGESAAVWLARAVANEANREKGTDVLLPTGQPGQPTRGQPGKHAANSLGSTLQYMDANPPPAPPPPLRTLDFAGLSSAMQAAVAVCGAADLPVPKTAARHFVGLLNGELRQARGLAPLKPRRPPASAED